MECDKTTSLIEKLGIKPGDRIAACLPTGQPVIELLLASLHVGAVFCPLNVRLPPAALEEQIERISPKLIFTSSGYTIRPSRPTSLPSASLLLFTSGSSGKPKIASISAKSFWNNAKSANAVCDFKPGDGWRLTLPMHHVGGLSIVFRCLAAGAQIILDDANRSVTHLSSVPAQLYKAWPVYPKLRCLLLGGGPVYDVPTELPCLISYGMTETTSLIMAGKTPHSLQPVAGKEIKLAEDGEILVRGDSLFNGYWDGEEVVSPLDADGWFATKDLGRFDPKCGYSIIGRKDNQFISGGENIQPEEIEAELLKIPGIIEAIVGPRPHDRFGMRPIAFLKTYTSHIDEVSIRSCLAERLPTYKIPDAFFPVEEASTHTLKIDRKKLFNT